MRKPRVNMMKVKDMRMLTAHGDMTDRQCRLAQALLQLVRIGPECSVPFVAGEELLERRWWTGGA